MPKLSPLSNFKLDEDVHTNVAVHSLPRIKRQIESLPTSRIEIAPDSKMKVDSSKPDSVFAGFKGIIQDVQVSIFSTLINGKFVRIAVFRTIRSK